MSDNSFPSHARVVIVGGGRLRRACAITDLREEASAQVRIASPDGDKLTAFLRDRFPAAQALSATAATVPDVTAAQVGAAAFADGLELHELAESADSLETVFLRLTSQEDVA